MTQEKKLFENTDDHGKLRKCWLPKFLPPFHSVFYTIKEKLHRFSQIKIVVCIGFSLEKAKILSSGMKGLNPSLHYNISVCIVNLLQYKRILDCLTLAQTSRCFCVTASLSKTLWEKEKLLLTNNISVSHHVVWGTGCHLYQDGNCRLQTLSVRKRLKFDIWERVNSVPNNKIR